MTTLFLDIETLPADDASQETLRYLYERKQEKTRERARTGQGGATGLEVEDFEQFLLRTSFDGAFGRILCIGYAFDDRPVEALTGEEGDMLARFWELARSARLFVGHNVMDFDLRFIYQRSIVCRVRPSVALPFARYRNDPIYDTMREWVKWTNTHVGLEHLALALGLPTPKEGIDGSQVFDYYKAGRLDEIVAYCKRDVETTRAVYRRMQFIT